MNRRTRFSIWFYLVVLGAMLLMQYLFFSDTTVQEITYADFRDRLADNRIEHLILTPDKFYGLMRSQDATKAARGDTSAAEAGGRFAFLAEKTPWRLELQEMEAHRDSLLKRQFVVTPVQGDEHLVEDLQAHGVDYEAHLENNWLSHLFLNWVIPFGLLFFLWGFFIRRMGRDPGVLSIGKSKAKIYEVDPSHTVTFDDVAGIDEAVEEVREVVDFLKNPGKYTRLGAKLPKGLLLVGPPGSGKTLLARALAGEAGVPFFSISGSDFVEMFVGVGAARVRDLFKEAATKAPCIIFIDELDAVGRSRGQGVFAGGFDERENTLNQLLVEMDGFDPTLGIIIVGATNRPEVLDPALLRPGRFDRQILVDRPTLQGRIDIFRVHTRKLVLADDVDLTKLAAATPGFAGAEIANICNEAALLASRRGHDRITLDDFLEAIERVIAGLEKRNKLINPYERKVVAYHESGHAIVGYFTPGADPVQKVSIVPRGIGALGYTWQTPLEDRYLMSHTELLGKIKGLLGGRAAEEIVFGDVSTGAANDLERVSQIARDMITIYGMSERMPNLSLADRNGDGFLGQGPVQTPHSEKIEEIIDEEVMEIIRACYEEDLKLLQEKRDKLDVMARHLLEQEKLDEDEIVEILGPRPVPVAEPFPPSKESL